jgi:hypothetical protein
VSDIEKEKPTSERPRKKAGRPRGTVASKVLNNKGVADGKISRAMSRQTVLAIAETNDARKGRAVEKSFVPLVNDGWKVQSRLWAEADDDTRRGYLYHMVLWSGVVMGSRKALGHVAKYFGIKAAELDPYLDVMWMADTARVLKITESTFVGFLSNDRDTSGKFHIGKQYAYQVNDPAHEGVDSVQAAPQIIFAEAPRPDPKVRQDVEQFLSDKVVQLDKKRG